MLFNTWVLGNENILIIIVQGFMRYARQIKLKEVGVKGQQQLKRSTVLVVGAGGLGCPVLQYLAAAGVGRIIVVDSDEVSISNLQRQILYQESDVETNKALAAARNLKNLNSTIEVVPISENITANNAERLMSGVDCVLDGSDNFSTKYLVNDSCAFYKIPLVQGNIHQWSGQVGVYHVQGKGDLRDVFPKPPAEEPPTCEEEGILGPIAGVVGSAMALEAIKIIIGVTQEHYFSTYDGLKGNWDTLKFASEERATIDYRLEDYDFYCAVVDKWMISSDAFSKSNESYLKIDVREEYEIEAKEENVVYLPLGDLREGFSKDVVKNHIPVFACGHGTRSKAAASWFRKKFSKDAYYLDEL